MKGNDSWAGVVYCIMGVIQGVDANSEPVAIMTYGKEVVAYSPRIGMPCGHGERDRVRGSRRVMHMVEYFHVGFGDKGGCNGVGGTDVRSKDTNRTRGIGPIGESIMCRKGRCALGDDGVVQHTAGGDVHKYSVERGVHQTMKEHGQRHIKWTRSRGGGAPSQEDFPVGWRITWCIVEVREDVRCWG